MNGVLQSGQFLPETIYRLFGFGDGAGPLVEFGAGLIAAFLIANLLLVMGAVSGPWLKRKLYADFTQRYAINRVGPYGLLIIVADALRFLSKELIVPENADRPAYDLAPIIMPFAAILGFGAIPMGSLFGVDFQLADPEVGLAFVFAASSMSTLGLVVGGYASSNKYSFLSGLRAIAQSIAYEIPLVVTGASIVLFAGTLRTSEIVAQQAETLATVGGIAIPSWYVLVNPLAFVLFLTATLAEVGRNPFDVPEAPNEIIAGYMTEYSGVYFVLLYLAEFLHIFLGGALIATLFLGGPAGPVLPGLVWMIIKIMLFFGFTQWARYSIPRVRIDQVITVGWKGLLVLAFGNFVLTAILVGFL